MIALDFYAGELFDYGVGAAHAEDGVAVVEVQSGSVHDEELLAVGVRAAVGHAQEAAFVVRRSGPDLVWDHVAGLARAGAARISALDHEALDHAMKRGAVVGGLLGPLAVGRFERSQTARQPDEVGDGDRRFVRVQLAIKLAEVGVDLRADGAFAGQPRGRVVERELAVEWIAVARRSGFCRGGGRRSRFSRRRRWRGLGRRDGRGATDGLWLRGRIRLGLGDIGMTSSEQRCGGYGD